jgi:flagellar basal-body rod modification protein FlgD
VNDLTWDGKNDSGAAVADGTYTFDVAASSGEKALDVTKLCFGMVNSVSSGSQGEADSFWCR